MNKKNNKRKKESEKRIKNVFFMLLKKKELKDITVSEICNIAKLNRSTFYANYIDIYDLADKVKEEMSYNNLELFKEESEKHYHSYDYLKLFKHIRQNQDYYKIMLKLEIDFTKYYDFHLEEEETKKYFGTSKYIDYHVEFFKCGFNAILKKWLSGGCKETAEEMEEILKSEYGMRVKNI